MQKLGINRSYVTRLTPSYAGSRMKVNGIKRNPCPSCGGAIGGCGCSKKFMEKVFKGTGFK